MQTHADMYKVLLDCWGSTRQHYLARKKEYCRFLRDQLAVHLPIESEDPSNFLFLVGGYVVKRVGYYSGISKALGYAYLEVVWLPVPQRGCGLQC